MQSQIPSIVGEEAMNPCAMGSGGPPPGIFSIYLCTQTGYPYQHAQVRELTQLPFICNTHLYMAFPQSYESSTLNHWIRNKTQKTITHSTRCTPGCNALYIYANNNNNPR